MGKASPLNEAMSCDQHIGGRRSQQDRTLCIATPDQRFKLLVVADGVGGHWGGEIAAQAVIDIAKHDFGRIGKHIDAPDDFLQKLCKDANHEIRERAAKHGEQAAYSTIVALLITPRRAYWAHVGDSRLYCFQKRQLVHRTKDHSLVQAMVDRGELAAEDINTHPDRNQLLRVLGMKAEVEVTQGEISLTRDTGFILCSDGFWDIVATDEMSQILIAQDLPFAVARWVRLAAQKAGREGDNVSLAAWRAGTASSGPSWRFGLG